MSLIVSVPEVAPETVGVYVTLIVQLALALTAAGQLLVSAKPALAAIELMLKVALPELVSVAASGLLEVPTVCALNVMLEEDRLTAGAGA